MGTKKRQKRSTLSHRKKATITTGYRNSSNKNGYRQLKQKGARETRIKYNLQRKATRKLASKQEELDQLQNDHKTLQADIEQLRIKLSHAQHLIETNYIFGKLEDINPTHTNHSNNEEYKAPHRETNHMDLMILFELIQYIQYRRLERTLNKVRRELFISQEDEEKEIQMTNTDGADSETSDDDSSVSLDGLDDIFLNSSSIPVTWLQHQIDCSILDGSSTEQLVHSKLFKHNPNHVILLCLTHGVCDLFNGIKDSLKLTRNLNKYNLVQYAKGALSALEIMIKVFGNTNFEHNTHSMQSGLIANDCLIGKSELFKMKKYPKTREKDLIPVIKVVLQLFNI
eukprot:156233_1